MCSEKVKSVATLTNVCNTLTRRCTCWPHWLYNEFPYAYRAHLFITTLPFVPGYEEKPLKLENEEKKMSKKTISKITIIWDRRDNENRYGKRRTEFRMLICSRWKKQESAVLIWPWFIKNNTDTHDRNIKRNQR